MPGHPGIGATHASEVPYVLGTLDDQRPMRPNYEDADQTISKTMQDRWTNFVKTGDPNSSWLPAWPQYQPDTRKYLEFTDNGPVLASAYAAGSARSMRRIYDCRWQEPGAVVMDWFRAD